MSDHDTWNMFAAAALAASGGVYPSTVATRAASIADALLAESKKRETPAEPTPPQPDDDGWIKWEGGECPVLGNTRVMFRFKNGEEDGPDLARNADWGPDWAGYTITAYRIVSEAGVTK